MAGVSNDHLRRLRDVIGHIVDTLEIRGITLAGKNERRDLNPWEIVDHSRVDLRQNTASRFGKTGS